MGVKISNRFFTQLSSPCISTDTTLHLVTTVGLPTVGGGDFTFLTLTSGMTAFEVVKVTAIAGSSVTVVRGQDGTTAQSFQSGARIELRVCAAIINELRGPQGDQGIPGSTGASGSRWHVGSGVPSDAVGVQHDLYLRGDNGQVYVKGASAWSDSGINIRGLTGAQGLPGPARWYYGAGVPSDATGGQYDLYLRGDNGQIYVKGVSTWSDAGVNIRGAAGAAGVVGSRWHQGGGAPSDAVGAQGDLYLRGDSGQIYVKEVSTWSNTGINLKGPTGIGSGGVNNLTPGGVVFGAPDGLISQDTGLHYNQASKFLGIGTNIPSGVLDVRTIPSSYTPIAMTLSDISGTVQAGYVYNVTLANFFDTSTTNNGCSYGGSSGPVEIGVLFKYARTVSKFRWYNDIQGSYPALGTFKIQAKVSGYWVDVAVTSVADSCARNSDYSISTNLQTGWKTLNFSPLVCDGIKIVSLTWNNGVWENIIREFEIFALPSSGSAYGLVITSDGRCCINGSAPFARHQVNGSTDLVAGYYYRPGTVPSDPIMQFASDVTTAGSVKCQINNSGDLKNINNSYGAISDVKLKEMINDTTPKLTDLMAVRVRNFNLIGDPLRQIGVIAQELETVFPGLVESVPDYEMIPDPDWTPDEGQTEADRPHIRHDLGTVTKSVKYSVFVPILIKALQEVYTSHVALEMRVTALETQNTQLAMQLSAIADLSGRVAALEGAA